MVYRHRTRPIAACLALALMGASTPHSADAQQQLTSVVARVAIVVADPERALHFYSYALGYRTTYDGTIDRPGLRALLGLKPAQSVRFIVLSNDGVVDGAHRDAAMIGLLYVSKPTLPKPRMRRDNSLRVGQAMLAVRTADIATVQRRLVELGSPILVQPATSADGSETELVALDPDGTRLQIVQRHMR